MESPRYSPCAACEVRDRAVCGVLQPHELERLNSIVTEVWLKPGQILFLQEDPADSVFVVTRGHIRLVKLLANGRRQVTGFLYLSDFLGLAYGAHYAFSAEAIDKATLCRFPREKLEAFFEEFPQLEKRLLQIASNELIAAQDQMILLGRKSALEKVATFLINLSRHAERRGEGGTKLYLPMNRTDIGDYLGLAVETTSRTLTQLARDGIIEIPMPQRIVLRQKEMLEEIAEGEVEPW
jgi:CRP/FNR family transcriptional regulator